MPPPTNVMSSWWWRGSILVKPTYTIIRYRIQRSNAEQHKNCQVFAYGNRLFWSFQWSYQGPVRQGFFEVQVQVFRWCLNVSHILSGKAYIFDTHTWIWNMSNVLFFSNSVSSPSFFLVLVKKHHYHAVPSQQTNTKHYRFSVDSSVRYKLGGVEKASKSGENPFEALQLGAFKTKALKEQAPRGSGQRVRWGGRGWMKRWVCLELLQWCGEAPYSIDWMEWKGDPINDLVNG